MAHDSFQIKLGFGIHPMNMSLASLVPSQITLGPEKSAFVHKIKSKRKIPADLSYGSDTSWLGAYTNNNLACCSFKEGEGTRIFSQMT